MWAGFLCLDSKRKVVCTIFQVSWLSTKLPVLCASLSALRLPMDHCLVTATVTGHWEQGPKYAKKYAKMWSGPEVSLLCIYMHLYAVICKKSQDMWGMKFTCKIWNMEKYATLAVLMSESESKPSIGLIQVVEIKKTDLIMLLWPTGTAHGTDSSSRFLRMPQWGWVSRKAGSHFNNHKCSGMVTAPQAPGSG